MQPYRLNSNYLPLNLSLPLTIVRQLSYDDVIGYEEVKKSLRRILSFSSSSMKNKVARFGLKSPGGALLYGPPGTYEAPATLEIACRDVMSCDVMSCHVMLCHVRPYDMI